MIDTTPSFYWFDYETFGRDSAYDRPAQFAGIRTRLDLQQLGEPTVLYNRLADDYLPDPVSCAITGITPQTCNERGLPEAEFIAAVRAELGRAGTCSLGYNSIGFDDHFTRHTLFRNFLDPYDYEWADGNSRWDLLDIVRLTRALRPEGISWPLDADGKPSNRLEALSAANDISHEHAHDALSDVHATIGMARLIRARQPRLFDYAFAHRGKEAVARKLDLRDPKPVILVNGRIGNARHNLAIVLPILREPGNDKAIWLFDLLRDPLRLLETSGEALLSRDSGLIRIRSNSCPVIVPLTVLRDEDAERLTVDRSLHLRHLEVAGCLQQAEFQARLIDAIATHNEAGVGTPDVDGSLYGGRFFSDADKRLMQAVRNSEPAELTGFAGRFDDPRLDEMLWRYRARNWPDSLDLEERRRWHAFCRTRLGDRESPWRDYASFIEALQSHPWTAEQQALYQSLASYGQDIADRYGLDRHVESVEAG